MNKLNYKQEDYLLEKAREEKLFNNDGTLTEKGKKTYKQSQQRKAARSTSQRHTSGKSRGFNLYDFEDIHPQTGDTTPEQAKELLFECVKKQ